MNSTIKTRFYFRTWLVVALLWLTARVLAKAFMSLVVNTLLIIYKQYLKIKGDLK